MFSVIFLQELRFWLKRPAFYIYLAIFFIAPLFNAAFNAGIFDSVTATTSSNYVVNSPLAITKIFMGLSTLCVFLFPSIIGLSIYRDYKSNMHNILYSYPFTKGSFLLAKFLSGVVIVTFIVSMIGVGLAIGLRLPGTNPDIVADFNFLIYLKTYLVFILPNILFYGAIVFGVVAFTRSISAGFIVIIILTLLNGSMEFILNDPTQLYTAALLDPFGGAALYHMTRYWTVVEQNTLFIPIKDILLCNRLLWLSISLLIASSVYKLFKFSQEPFTLSSKKHGKPNKIKQNIGGIIKVKLPNMGFNFGLSQQLKILWKMSTIDFRYIIKSIPFLLILVAGLIMIIVEFSQGNNYQGTPELPVTWKMVKFSEAYVVAIHICTFLFAGMLLQRAKTTHFNQLLDITPIPNWTLLVSKLVALWKMQLLMLSVAMIAGLTFQIYHGYYHFELEVYLIVLFFFNFTYFIIWSLLALFIQILVKNPYVGLIMLFILLISIPLLQLVGVEQSIFKYGQGLGLMYSDMDGFGSFLSRHIIYASYWIMAGIIFLLIAYLFMARGLTQSIREHLLNAKSRFSTRVAIALSVLLIGFVSMGATIYYENNVNNIRTSAKQLELLQLGWEQQYKKFENSPQPRIVGVKTEMNIFPNKRDFDASGTYLMVNKTAQTIDTVFVKYAAYPTTINLDQAYRMISDSLYGFNILLLEESLQPGDSLELSFSVKNKPNNILRDNSPIKGNGTKITNKELYPSIGYKVGFELKDDDLRMKYGLMPKPVKPHPTDTTALGNHMMSRDSDWITYEATVSTSEDQIAITSGQLQNEWIEQGRRYFHYKMNKPILNFFSFSSGRFEVLKDEWNDVALEIYYHKGHNYNLDRMMAGMKASLEYCSRNFSPYQFKQARIIEFARTIGGGAQGFPNTVPFSEGHGFIANVNDSDDEGVDYPFAVTVHEIAHQWWAHQVMGADVLGASMLTESLSDYVRLKVLEHQYGKSKMRTYLKYSLDAYLRKRGGESRNEQALMYNEGQSYIRYSKGSMVFYALSDYIGEDILNDALKKYVEKVQFQKPPYTTTLELVDHIRAVTPDTLQYVIEDMFERITVYDNKTINFTSTELENGNFQVEITFNVSKYRNDVKGRSFYSDNKRDSISYRSEDMNNTQYSLPLADYIDIGIFGKEGEQLYLQKHKITEIHNNLSLIVNQKPIEVGVDPYNKLIDRNSMDNRFRK